MDVTIQPPTHLHGILHVPPDKAICHRALLIGALAKGVTTIHPWPAAEDCQRTLDLIQHLGVSVRRSDLGVEVQGGGALHAPADDLYCGESGTTLRLAAGLLAGQPFAARLTAGPSLSRRPMRRVVEPLTRMGARLEGTVPLSGSPELHPPLTVHGRRPLRPIRYETPVASAQVKSAILLAALFAEGPSTVVERHPTRDHTERLLRACGVRVDRDGAAVSIRPGGIASPGVLVVPGDFSSAAFFLVAAACVPGSRVTLDGVGLNPTRTSLLEVLTRMGAEVRQEIDDTSWEPRGTVTVEARPLRGITVDSRDVPALIDELPILMVAAACARGTTRFAGVGELRVKETDRVRSMATGLQRFGVRVRETAPDTVEVTGGRLRGAEVDSAGDHRTAMSLAVAAMAADGPSTIRDAGAIAKSFPEFYDHLRQVAGSTTVTTVDDGKKR